MTKREKKELTAEDVGRLETLAGVIDEIGGEMDTDKGRDLLADIIVILDPALIEGQREKNTGRDLLAEGLTRRHYT